MPFDQNQLPTWNKEGVEPPQSLKDDGWQPSQKPPADYFNWFFNKTFKALQSLFTNAQHKDEKGQPNGYAALNAEGKVVNADGSLAGGVQSVNNKTGAVTLTASDVGAETPAGAQAKVDAHAADSVKHITAAERTAWNNKLDASEVVTTPAANKVLRLDVNGKLPASITGNADGNAATASKLQTARTISLTGDATGSTSFDGSANASISVTLANTGVTAGTYPKVTVDSKGRVTAGQALSASDIPNLDWTKITTGKPTTLSGYGITDAIPTSQKGAANGVASLDGGAKVPTTQLPNASTSAPGIVQLVDSVSSTSVIQAPTANAVKTINDALDAHSADNVKHITAEERAAWNSAEANAKAYTDSAPEAMQRNLGIFNIYKSGKDSNGIFTTVDYKRSNGTLYARSVLSGGTSPQYTTRTITYYGTDGTTVLRTDTFTLTYDANGDLVSEVKQ